MKTESPATFSTIKGVLFGPPKTGKTVASCRAKIPTLLVELEPDGDLSLTGTFANPKIEVVKPQTWQEINDVVQALHTTDRTTYKVVVVDSVTFLQERVGGKDILKTFIEGKDVRRAYGKAGAAVNQLMFDFLALPVHVIFTAQMREIKPDQEGGIMRVEEGQSPLDLDVTPMVRSRLTPSASFMGRTFKKAVIRGKERRSAFMVSFDDQGRSPAGSRLGLPPEVENFNLIGIIRHIQGGK
jgi:hypothetical protein